MTRLQGFAFSLAMTLMTAACAPVPTAALGSRPIPASSGTLRLVDGATAGQPPTLVLETADAPVTRSSEEMDKTIYVVVVNVEEQYSIWPADRDTPLGWKAVGKTGTKAECLDYIRQVWTDMRPLSLRKKMDETAKQQQK